MSIFIGADIAPTNSNKAYFDFGNMQDVDGAQLLNLLRCFDHRIFNVECSHENAGFESTTKIFEKEKILFVGVGENRESVTKPFVIFADNKKIEVYACIEFEFSIVEDNKYDFNPFDSLKSFDHVSNLKKECDYVIVLYLGSKEHFCHLSPVLQRVCPKFVKNGTDLVACQYSLYVGCEEKYHDETIAYGQGCFIFNTCYSPTEQTSLLIKIGDNFNVEYIPLEKYACGARLAIGKKSKRMMSEFFQRSKEIQNSTFVENEYAKFAKKMLNGFIFACSGYYHFFLRCLLNKINGYGMTKKMGAVSFTKEDLFAIQNYIECRLHHELWFKGLKGDFYDKFFRVGCFGYV